MNNYHLNYQCNEDVREAMIDEETAEWCRDRDYDPWYIMDELTSKEFHQLCLAMKLIANPEGTADETAKGNRIITEMVKDLVDRTIVQRKVYESEEAARKNAYDNARWDRDDF